MRKYFKFVAENLQGTAKDAMFFGCAYAFTGSLLALTAIAFPALRLSNWERYHTEGLVFSAIGAGVSVLVFVAGIYYSFGGLMLLYCGLRKKFGTAQVSTVESVDHRVDTKPTHT